MQTPLDKEFWASVAGNEYRLPEGHTLEELSGILFGFLRSTDPELRDDIAYTVYANWLERDLYSGEVLKAHIEILLSNLDKGIGEVGSDTVFLRAFSVLFLAEIVHHDNKRLLLEKEHIQGILARGLMYLEAEKDPRGHIPVKGWAHALAHTADLLLVLGRNRHVEADDLMAMLHGISSKMIHSVDAVYTHGEDDRLASAVIEILRRGRLPGNRVESWARSFAGPEHVSWKGAYLEADRNRAFHNTRNLLRSIHLHLSLDEEPGSLEGYRTVFLDALRNLRPY